MEGSSCINTCEVFHIMLVNADTGIRGEVREIADARPSLPSCAANKPFFEATYRHHIGTANIFAYV